MLSVSFNQPIVISAENLNSLLTLANTPAVVTPYVDAAPAPAAPAKRVRGGKAAAPTGDKPKRTRATKAEMEARRAAAAGGETPKPETPPADPVPETPAADAAPAKVEAASEAPAKPKRDRRSAAKKAADAAAAKTADAKQSKPSGGGGSTAKSGSSKAASKEPPKSAAPSEYAEGLLARFATLIDSDFAAASAMLAEFGVKRFSELKPEQHKAFDAKLTEAKV